MVYNYTEAYTTFGLKVALAPDVPNNEGSFRAVTVRAPEGSVLNCLHPAPTAARHLLGHFLAGMVLAALGWLPRVCLAGIPFGLWVDRWLRDWSRQPAGGSERWARGLAVRLLVCALLGLLALCAYVYLPVRAAQNPPANLGDPRTLERIAWVVSAKVYANNLSKQVQQPLSERFADSGVVLVDHLDGVEEAALPGDAERREPVLAHHCIDFLRRQQPWACAVWRARPCRRIGTAKIRDRRHGRQHLRLRADGKQSQARRQTSGEQLHRQCSCKSQRL